MNPLSLIKVKLRKLTNPKSDSINNSNVSPLDNNAPKEADFIVSNETNSSKSKPKEKPAKQVNFNAIRIQRKGTLNVNGDQKNINNRSHNFGLSPEKKLVFPDFTNALLKENMEMLFSRFDKKVENSEKGINTESIEEVSIPIQTKPKAMSYDLSLPLINQKDIVQNKRERMKSDHYISHFKMKAEYAKNVNNFPYGNNFDVDERVFNVKRFDHHLKNELSRKLINKSNRINKSLNLNSSNSDSFQLPFNQYQSIKMAMHPTKKLLPIKLSKERGIEALSKKMYEKIRRKISEDEF